MEMKPRHQSNSSETRGNSDRQRTRPQTHRWRTFGIILGILIVVGVIVRALLPWIVRDYVNRTLDRNILYSGKIGEVNIHLWRGAYSIHDVGISKTTGNVPVPLFQAKTVDFSLQWDALLHGKIVGRVVIDQPQLNFVDAQSASDAQTGAGGPWLEMIRDLFPFKINSAQVHNGEVHFRAYITKNPVDVYLAQFEATIDNLTNIRDQTQPLISTVQATALVMSQAKFEYKMTFDPFSYRPTFHMALRVLGLDVTKINDLARAYGKFDFKRGWFDLVVESTAQEGQLTGYAKPLFRNLKVFSLAEDVKQDNVIQFFWQALVGATASVFKNQPRDQFGTLIPFTGGLSQATTPNILATIGNLLRNAFVRAYLPELQSGQQDVEGLQFEAPDVTGPISDGASP